MSRKLRPRQPPARYDSGQPALRLPSFLASLLEWPYLLGLNIVNTFYNLGHYLLEIRRFYGDARLRRLDWLWQSRFLKSSPFAVSARERDRYGLDPTLTVYGETPWTTLADILDSLPVTPADCFYELGCGTGRNLAFVQLRYGIPVVGFEIIPSFAATASWLARQLGITGQMQVYCRNWFEADLAPATILYITGTTYTDETIEFMEEKLADIAPGCWVISLSYPIVAAGLELVREGVYAFSWGQGSVFIHRKREE